jgi:hypothetical protein
MREEDDDRIGGLHGMILSKVIIELKNDNTKYDLMFVGDKHFHSDYDEDDYQSTSGRI